MTLLTQYKINLIDIYNSIILIKLNLIYLNLSCFFLILFLAFGVGLLFFSCPCFSLWLRWVCAVVRLFFFLLHRQHCFIQGPFIGDYNFLLLLHGTSNVAWEEWGGFCGCGINFSSLQANTLYITVLLFLVFKKKFVVLFFQK